LLGPGNSEAIVVSWGRNLEVGVMPWCQEVSVIHAMGAGSQLGAKEPVSQCCTSQGAIMPWCQEVSVIHAMGAGSQLGAKEPVSQCCTSQGAIRCQGVRKQS